MSVCLIVIKKWFRFLWLRFYPHVKNILRTLRDNFKHCIGLMFASPSDARIFKSVPTLGGEGDSHGLYSSSNVYHFYTTCDSGRVAAFRPQFDC